MVIRAPAGAVGELGVSSARRGAHRFDIIDGFGSAVGSGEIWNAEKAKCCGDSGGGAGGSLGGDWGRAPGRAVKLARLVPAKDGTLVASDDAEAP